TINIVAVALLPDTCHPGQTALIVGGTLGNDSILFSPAGNSGDVTVKLNGATLGTYHPTGRLVAYGQAGNDDIQVAAGINLSAWLYGDGGNDRLNAGNASPGGNLLFGGDGNDELLGGSGRDIMIGGQGADKFTGNANDDILIAGLTTFDSRSAAGHEDFWCRVLKKWTDINVEFLDRVYALRTGTGANLLASVMDDNSVDQIDMLQGSSGNDWFLFKADEDKVVGQTEYAN
ncbi:MAG: calcium-binding protein, partial [Planctomycetales bacterium]